MVSVATEIFGGKLPVAGHNPLVHATDHFGAAFPPVKESI